MRFRLKPHFLHKTGHKISCSHWFYLTFWSSFITNKIKFHILADFGMSKKQLWKKKNLPTYGSFIKFKIYYFFGFISWNWKKASQKKTIVFQISDYFSLEFKKVYITTQSQNTLYSYFCSIEWNWSESNLDYKG